CHRVRIIVARRYVQKPALRVDCWGGLDTGAGRTELICPGFGDTRLLWGLHHEGSPDYGSITDAEGSDAAPKCTAHILGIDRARLFPRCCRNEHNPFVSDRRTREPRRFVLFDAP